MARGEAKVSEDKLQALMEGWNKKDISELAKTLGAKGARSTSGRGN
jgi:hypothetical protein